MIIRVMNDKPAVGILNWEETADYLRVRSQTVYNMIKDGRIKSIQYLIFLTGLHIILLENAT